MIAFLFAALLVQTPAADTAKLRKELQDVASDYENTLRSKAPHRLGQSGFCSEQVGRYCVIYDAGRLRPGGAEPREVRESRAKAIAAYTRGVAAWPEDSTLVAPLIRYLVEDGRGPDAVTVARAYLEKTIDAAAAWAYLLLGYALHGAGDDGAADEAYARGLRLALPMERMQLHDLSFLLARDEREKYNALRGAERGSYQARLWSLADPLYLTPGNESLVEHLSRGVFNRIQQSVPGTEWQNDSDVLNLRYGTPTERTLQFTPNSGRIIVESFHPEQLTYIPPAMLTRGGVTRFEPGSAWPYDTIRAHSGYAPRSIRWMQVLPHQVSRFVLRDSVEMRADFRMTLDSAVSLPARVEVALFALDSMYNIVGAQVDTIVAEAREFSGRLSTRATVHARAYSVEARELGTLQAGRARYALAPLPRGRLTLSDLVMVMPSGEAPARSRTSPDFKPLSTLDLAKGTPIGLFIETRGLARTPDRTVRYRVDLEVLEQERPGVFSRAVRGLARSLGVARQDVAPRISWTETQPHADVTTISLQLGQVNLEPGLKLFRVTVTDLASGAASAAVVDRLIRVR